MAEALAAAAPVRAKERIHSLDVVRGAAVLGILLINITAFGLPSAYDDPTVWGGDSGANLWAWIKTTTVVEGTQRGLFAMLFGAGLILLTSRLEAARRTDVADIFTRRALWLVVFGLVHSYLLLWTGDVLYYYGLTALLLYPLRKLSSRSLLSIAAAGLVAAAVWNVGDGVDALAIYDRGLTAQAVVDAGEELTDEQLDDLDDWIDLEEDHKPSAEELTEDVEAHKGSYLDVVIYQAPINAYFQSWWFYRDFFDLFSVMLVGMAFFKLGVLTLERPTRFYVAMVVVGYTIGLAVNYYELRIILDGEFSVLAFMRAHRTYDLGRLGMTAGHLGLLLLFCRSGWLRWLQRSLAAVGRMALSNYVTQSIVCAVVFNGFGFGLYGDLERHQLYYVVGWIWLFQLIVSPIWLRYYRFGPLEWLWRSLTYAQRQPLRRIGTDKPGVRTMN